MVQNFDFESFITDHKTELLVVGIPTAIGALWLVQKTVGKMQQQSHLRALAQERRSIRDGSVENLQKKLNAFLRENESLAKEWEEITELKFSELRGSCSPKSSRKK